MRLAVGLVYKGRVNILDRRLSVKAFPKFKLFNTILFIALLGTPAVADETPAECHAQNVEFVSTPKLPNRVIGLQNALKKFERAPADAEILLIGDSLAEAWDVIGLAAALGKTVANLGVGGDRTQTILWRLDQMDRTKFDPTDILLLAGTNNLSDRDPACAIGAGLAQIGAKIHDAWPNAHLWVLETPPRGLDFAEKMPDRLDMYRIMEEQLDFEATFLNFDAELTCGVGSFPESYFDPIPYRQRPPSPCANYRQDLAHLEPAGYELLTQKLTERLK